jgi:hypothetical protein
MVCVLTSVGTHPPPSSIPGSPTTAYCTAAILIVACSRLLFARHPPLTSVLCCRIAGGPAAPTMGWGLRCVCESTLVIATTAAQEEELRQAREMQAQLRRQRAPSAAVPGSSSSPSLSPISSSIVIVVTWSAYAPQPHASITVEATPRVARSSPREWRDKPHTRVIRAVGPSGQ